MNQKTTSVNSQIYNLHTINPLNQNNNQKNAQNNIQPNKKLINTGKMVLNPYKLNSDQQNCYNNLQVGKQSIHNRPTTTTVVKEDNFLPQMLQGKAMSLNTTKIPQREQMHSSHQNKGLPSNQTWKQQPNNIPKPQQQYQHQQFNQSKINKAQGQPKIENQQLKQQQLQQQQQINKKQDLIEGLMLDDYFKMPASSGNKQVSQEILKINDHQTQQIKISDNTSQRVVHSMISDNLSESDRNIHSAGIVYNGDNDAEFFGYEMEEIDIEKSIQELKKMSLHLSFNLMKCDLDDIRGNQDYEQFIQEIINYLHNLSKLNHINQLQLNEHQIKQLQFFIFNGIEDCLFSRDMNIQLISSLKNDIQNYPQKVIEAFAKRIENKFFMVEDSEKIDECFRLFVKYLHLNNYLNQTILNTILKLIKVKRMRDILCEFFKLQVIDDLINNEYSLILLFTLKSYQCLTIELPPFSIERFSSNKILCKLYKRHNYNNQQ